MSENDNDNDKRVTLHTKITLMELIIGMLKQSRKKKGFDR